MERIVRLVVDHPALTLLAVAALTLVAVSQIVDLRTGELRLRIDPSVSRLIPEGTEEREFYDLMRRRFGSDDTLTVALVADDVFSPDILPRIERMTERFEQVEGVSRVVSLARALNIRGRGSELVIEPFYTGRMGDDPVRLAALRREALENPVYAGNLVSRDGRATALVVYLRRMTDRQFIDAGLDLRLAAIAEAERGPAQVWMTGPPRVRAETSRVLRADLWRIVPAGFAVAGLVALLAFRTLRGVAIPVTSVLLALVWTLGALAWAGRPLSLVTTILPPLIIAIGLAYAVHVVAAYYAALGEEGRRGSSDPVQRAIREVGLPVLLTALTTCAGFASLTVSSLSAIREFGIFATLGVLAALVASLTYAPALLQLLPAPRSRPRPGHPAGRGGLDRALEALARFDLRRRNAILLTGAAVCAVAVYGTAQVRAGNDIVGNFYPGSRVRQHFEAINESLGGASPFYVVLETDIRDAFKQPANLRMVEELQRWLARQPEVGSATSLVDYVKVINWGFHDNDPAYRVIPATTALTDQLIFFGGNRELRRYADVGYRRTRILVRANVIDSISLQALVRRVRERVATLPEHVRGRVTGNMVLVTQAVDDIARGQAESLSVAFVVIYAILALLFTSFRVGLIALIPNAIPVLLYFGAMGLTGVTLNATTSLVACLVLGIAVDDSIHYIARFNHCARERADEAEGTLEALRSVGRPVTWTTVALCLGLLTLTSANLREQVQFGALSAFTLFAAWLIDMTFTPALCSRLRIVTLWDVLTLDLGRDPQRSIPVFEGLRRAEARVVALMMRMRTLEKGEPLFRSGERGDEMYVVIDGELQASITRADGGLLHRPLRRGDVVGEVALFHGSRTADVDVVSDARLLRLTAADLEQLRRRYPRIGSIVYRNVSKILADRTADNLGSLR